MGGTGHLTGGLRFTVEIIRAHFRFGNNAACFLLTAFITVNNNNAILFTLGDGFVWTHKCAYRLSAVVAG